MSALPYRVTDANSPIEQARTDANVALDLLRYDGETLMLPVDLRPILDGFEIKVRSEPLLENVRSVITKDGYHHDAVVTLTEGLSPKGRRVCLARAIGYCMDARKHGSTAYQIVDYAGQRSSDLDAYVREFSMSLLMPTEYLRVAMDTMSMVEISKLFQVPYNLSTNRCLQVKMSK